MIQPSTNKCPACGSTAAPVKNYRFNSARKPDEKWALCPDCGSFYSNEEWNLDEAVDISVLEGLNRPDTWKQMLDFKSRIYETVVSYATRFAPPPARLLDVGCSYGGVLLKAKAKGYQCTGVDIVKEALDFLNSQGIETRLTYTIDELDPAKKYDIATAIDMNMCWPDQPNEIDAISQRLADKGHFIIKIVDKSWLIHLGLSIRNVMPAVGNKMISRSINNHRFSMPTKSFLELLRKKNFTIVATSVSDAVISDGSALPVKSMFTIGALIKSVTGAYRAPGVLVVARKI